MFSVVSTSCHALRAPTDVTDSASHVAWLRSVRSALVECVSVGCSDALPPVKHDRALLPLLVDVMEAALSSPLSHIGGANSGEIADVAGALVDFAAMILAIADRVPDVGRPFDERLRSCDAAARSFRLSRSTLVVPEGQPSDAEAGHAAVAAAISAMTTDATVHVTLDVYDSKRGFFAVDAILQKALASVPGDRVAAATPAEMQAADEMWGELTSPASAPSPLCKALSHMARPWYSATLPVLGFFTSLSPSERTADLVSLLAVSADRWLRGVASTAAVSPTPCAPNVLCGLIMAAADTMLLLWPLLPTMRVSVGRDVDVTGMSATAFGQACGGLDEGVAFAVDRIRLAIETIVASAAFAIPESGAAARAANDISPAVITVLCQVIHPMLCVARCYGSERTRRQAGTEGEVLVSSFFHQLLHHALRCISSYWGAAPSNAGARGLAACARDLGVIKAFIETHPYAVRFQDQLSLAHVGF